MQNSTETNPVTPPVKHGFFIIVIINLVFTPHFVFQ